MIDFSAVQGAGIFQIPRPMYFGMKFEASAVMTLVILFIINSVQAIGDLFCHKWRRIGQRTYRQGAFRGNHWIWNYEYFRFFLWRVANCDVQPECWNRGNNEGSKPRSVRTWQQGLSCWQDLFQSSRRFLQRFRSVYLEERPFRYLRPSP